MQQRHFPFRLLLIIFGAASLFSFTSPNGSDRYEIYLNKKLVFQEFVSQETYAVRSFPLDRDNYNATIDVVYSHCGAAGKNRVIKITDAKNHLLKEWNFADSKDDKSPMTCFAKDILLAQKDNPVSKVNIYYSSEQLPKGRLLATIILVDHNARP